MARRMSFSATTAAVLNQTKTVTRRRPHTWTEDRCPPGTQLIAVEKTMGLSKGTHQTILAHIEITSNRVEPLRQILVEPDGPQAEGFDRIEDFFDAWQNLHHGSVDLDQLVRRIDFRYLNPY